MTALIISGLLPPIVTVLSLTTTSATINFTQPKNSLPTDAYLVSLTLANKESQLCQHTGDTIIVERAHTLVDFVNLSEFSVYDVMVSIMNSAYRASKSVTYEFTTLSTCMSLCNSKP